MTEPARQPHAVLNLASRNGKALKIERLLGLASRPQPMRMLEVGTGAGGIAHYFGTHPTLRCEVSAVDVVDSRQVKDGYAYQNVAGIDLPSANDAFDVVISNHVIEHVDDAAAQVRHLAEICRVLRTSGVAYLAVPNRWMLAEPHFRVMFLSWWPRPLRTPYLRLLCKGAYYDCEPLQMRPLERMLDTTGFRYRSLCVEALCETFEIEHPRSLVAWVLRHVPDALLRPFRRIVPTSIYRLGCAPT